MSARRRLYRLAFGPRTITIEGGLLLLGLALILAGHGAGNDTLIQIGTWLT